MTATLTAPVPPAPPAVPPVLTDGDPDQTRPVFTLNDPAASAYLTRCRTRGGRPGRGPLPGAAPGESFAFPGDWNPRQPGRLDDLEQFIREAGQCGAIAARFPGYSVILDTCQGDREPLHLWRVTLPGTQVTLASCEWTPVAWIGSGHYQDQRDARSLMVSAVSEGNWLTAQLLPQMLAA